MAKITISTANRMKKNRHYLPTTTLTTCDVAQIFPVNILPTTPGDTFSIDHVQISQSIPTAVKTFGAFHIRTFAFFVPHRVVMPKFEETLARSVDQTLNTGFVKFSLFELYQALFGLYVAQNDPLKYDLDAEHSPYVDVSDYDSGADISLESFPLTTHGQEQGIMRFTARGRLLLKILQGLGYEIPLCVPSSSLVSDFLTQQYDVLPLLSFARFFYDFVYPSSYVSQQGFGYLFEGLQGYSTSQWLSKLLDLFFVPMEQDFFTSLWLRPNQKALGSSAVDITARSQVSTLSYSLNVNAGTPSSPYPDVNVLQNNSAQTSTLSATSLRWLEALSDFVIRNNVGGQRFHEWMKAHFGYVTIPEDSVRSIFLKSWNDTLNFSQVTASTGVGDQLLGDRAAQGNSQGQGKLKFECKEHGFLIYACMVVPSHDYFQGLKPWCRAITSPDDFYTPELDSVDMAPVPYSSVLNSFRVGESNNAIINHPNDAFGFAPRYAEKYKVGWSFLNGDFRLPSRMAGKDAYHTFRNVSYGRSVSNKLALDAQFLQADNQYDRIYAIAPEATEQEQLNDKIETFFLFNTVKYSSQLSIGDSMPLFDKSGRDVTLENGGTQI